MCDTHLLFVMLRIAFCTLSLSFILMCLGFWPNSPTGIIEVPCYLLSTSHLNRSCLFLSLFCFFLIAKPRGLSPPPGNSSMCVGVILALGDELVIPRLTRRFLHLMVIKVCEWQRIYGGRFGETRRQRKRSKGNNIVGFCQLVCRGVAFVNIQISRAGDFRHAEF